MPFGRKTGAFATGTFVCFVEVCLVGANVQARDWTDGIWAAHNSLEDKLETDAFRRSSRGHTSNNDGRRCVCAASHGG